MTEEYMLLSLGAKIKGLKSRIEKLERMNAALRESKKNTPTSRKNTIRTLQASNKRLLAKLIESRTEVRRLKNKVEIDPDYIPEKHMPLIQRVSDAIGISVKEIFAKKRTRNELDAKHVIYYILMKGDLFTPSELGRDFKKDHSIFYHSKNKITSLLETNQLDAKYIPIIKSELGSI